MRATGLFTFLYQNIFPLRFDGSRVVDVVEIYDLETNKWRAGSALTHPRSGHASAVSCSPCLAHSAAGTC